MLSIVTLVLLILSVTHISAVHCDWSVGAVPQSNVEHCTILHTYITETAVVTKFIAHDPGNTV